MLFMAVVYAPIRKQIYSFLIAAINKQAEWLA
jgi:hypothetical protein